MQVIHYLKKEKLEEIEGNQGKKYIEKWAIFYLKYNLKFDDCIEKGT